MRFMSRGVEKSVAATPVTNGTWSTKESEPTSISAAVILEAAVAVPVAQETAGSKRRRFRSSVDFESTAVHTGIITLDGVTGFQGRMSFAKFNTDVDKKSKAQAAADPVANSASGEDSFSGQKRTRDTDSIETSSPQQLNELSGRASSNPRSVYGGARLSSGGKPQQPPHSGGKRTH
jgi:hypothetical protein